MQSLLIVNAILNRYDFYDIKKLLKCISNANSCRRCVNDVLYVDYDDLYNRSIQLAQDLARDKGDTVSDNLFTRIFFASN